MADLNLPILDLSQLDAGPDAAARFRDDLRAATHDVGFFYLTGTGVSPELEARLHRAARDFFALPEADKLAIENVKSPHFRGYTRDRRRAHAGQGRLARADRHRPRARRPITDPDAPDFARLIGPNLWPDAQPELREVVSEWHDHLSGVARKLLRAWALALGAPENYFDEHFGEPSTLIKIVRYPGKDDPTPQQGVGAHKDSGVLTLLWVEPGKGGLQVERDGEWVDAPPVPGRSSSTSASCSSTRRSGYLIATNHRVSRRRYPDDRISVPFFFNPALDKRLPIIELPAELAAEARGRHSGPDQPDPRALRRERAQVPPARPPGRRRDPPRRPGRGAGRGIRLTHLTRGRSGQRRLAPGAETPRRDATAVDRCRRPRHPAPARADAGTRRPPHTVGRPSEEVR